MQVNEKIKQINQIKRDIYPLSLFKMEAVIGAKNSFFPKNFPAKKHLGRQRKSERNKINALKAEANGGGRKGKRKM